MMVRESQYYVCVTVMCCYSTVWYRFTVMCVCVCYYNMLLQCSWVRGYRSPVGGRNFMLERKYQRMYAEQSWPRELNEYGFGVRE
jgi:hypothetical protein